MHEPGGPLIDSTLIGPILAVVGGVVSYLQRLKRKKDSIFSFAEVVGECVIAGFVGVLTSLVCQSQGVDWQISAALAGISGHMGSRVLYLAEKQIEKRIRGAGE